VNSASKQRQRAIFQSVSGISVSVYRQQSATTGNVSDLSVSEQFQQAASTCNVNNFSDSEQRQQVVFRSESASSVTEQRQRAAPTFNVNDLSVSKQRQRAASAYRARYHAQLHNCTTALRHFWRVRCVLCSVSYALYVIALC